MKQQGMFPSFKKIIASFTLLALIGGLQTELISVKASEFGITTPGVNVYPNDGLEKLGKINFGGASKFIASAKDEAGGFIYMSTNTSPASIVKIRTSDFQQMDSLTFLSGEGYANTLRIDPANDIGYAGLGVAPGKIIKFRLSTLERITSLTLAAGEDTIVWGQIDVNRGFAYYSTTTIPAKIVKVNLTTFTEEAVLTLDVGETDASAAVIDDANNILYVGLQVDKVVKIDLNTFTRIGAISTPINEGYFSNGAFDPVGGYVYMGTSNIPSRIYKINVNGGAFAFEETFVMNAGEGGLPSLFWKAADSSLYAVLSTNPAKVVQVAVGGVGPVTMTRGNSITLNAGEDRGYAGQIDPAGNIFIGTYTSPSSIVEVSTSPALARLSGMKLTPTQSDVHDAVMEPDGSVGYFLVKDQPGVVAKVDLPSMTWLGAIVLPLDNSSPAHQPDVGTNALMLDHIHHKLYVSVDSWTGNDYLEQIDTETFTIESRIVLANGGMDAGRGVMDAAGNFAYFVTCNSTNPKVYKFDVNPASGTYKQVVATSPDLDVVSGCLRSVAIDETDGPGYVYAGRRSTPGKIYKVRMDTMASIGVLSVTGTTSIDSLAIDTVHHFLYGGDDSNPGRIFKINLTTFLLDSMLVLGASEKQVFGIAIDTVNEILYASTYDGPSGSGGVVVKINPTTMTRLASSHLPGADWGLFRALFDIIHGVVYLADDVYTPITLTKVSLSKKGRFYLTKTTLTEAADIVNSVRFYSHLATGNARFGIYTLAGRLLWESPELTNTALNTWVRADIKDGTPNTLTLPAGDYYLGFQTDTDAPVASYRLGAANTGQFAIVPFGAFPTDLTQLALTPSTDNFVLSAVYNDNITITQSGGTTVLTEGAATDDITYVLKSAPTADVTIDLTPSSALTLSTNTLTFTTLNWNVPQTITVTHPIDGVAQGNRNETITHAITTADVNYSALTVADINVAVTDVNLPTAPAASFANAAATGAQSGNASPSNVTGGSIVFSAKFSDPDTGDTASKYQLQIGSDENFTTLIYDSGAAGTTLAVPTPTGTRSMDITAPSFVGTIGTTYYYRIKFWDALGNEGAFTSSGPTSARFTVTVPLYLGGGGGGGGSASTETIPSIPSLKEAAPSTKDTTITQPNTNSTKAPAGTTATTTPSGTTTTSTTSSSSTNSTSSQSTSTSTNNSTNETPVGRFNIPFKDTVCAEMKAQPVTQDLSNISEKDLQGYVEKLLQKGVIFSHDSSVFEPYSTVNRSELLRYAIQTNCEDFQTLISFDAPFPDVPTSHKDALFIALAKMKKIVSGYLHDGTYKPDTSISRAEALKIVLEIALGDGARTFEGTAQPFTDVDWNDPQAWYKGYLSFAYEKGIVLLPEDKSFRPNDPALKSEIIYMLSRALALK